MAASWSSPGALLPGKAFNLRWKESRRCKNPRQNAEVRWNTVRWNQTWCCPEDTLCLRCFPIALTISTTTVYQTNWKPYHPTGLKFSLKKLLLVLFLLGLFHCIFISVQLSLDVFCAALANPNVFLLMCFLIIILHALTRNHIVCKCAIQIDYAARGRVEVPQFRVFFLCVCV